VNRGIPPGASPAGGRGSGPPSRSVKSLQRRPQLLPRIRRACLLGQLRARGLLVPVGHLTPFQPEDTEEPPYRTSQRYPSAENRNVPR
jgi:hypothetical protein